MLAELVSYQCVEVMPLSYRVLILEGKTFEIGNQHLSMVRVNLATNLLVTPMGPAVVKTGWMMSSALITRSQIEALIKQRQAEQK